MAFRIHHYDAKEHGLMIIGTASDLRELGERLLNECRDAPEAEEVEWPRHVAGVVVSNAFDYSVSFHLETRNQAQPAGNGLQNETAKTVVFLLALVGLFAGSVGSAACLHQAVVADGVDSSGVNSAVMKRSCRAWFTLAFYCRWLQAPCREPACGPARRARRHEFVIRDFRSERRRPARARVVYSTLGTLNARGDNAILLPSHYMANFNGYNWRFEAPTRAGCRSGATS
jgi:hypothetical protein